MIVSCLFTYTPAFAPSVVPNSSPGWSTEPLPFSPYLPGRTTSVSPATALTMPCEIDRHGASEAPHVGESRPLLAMYNVLPVVVANAGDARMLAPARAP